MSRAKAPKDGGKAIRRANSGPEISPNPLLTRARVTAAVLVFLFAVGALLRLAHVDDVTSRSPDERVYVNHARRIVDKGLSEFPVLLSEYNRDRRLWIYPPPWRIGYLAPLAGAMIIGGVADERAGVWLSYLCSLASLALLGVIGARFLPSWVAIYAMLCLALSLPELVIARRCWQDACMGLLGLLLVWSACEITRDHQKWWSYLVLVGAGSVSVLVKELGAFVYGGCVVYVSILLLRRRAWRALAGLLLGGFAGAALSMYVFTFAAGGLTPLLTGWQHMTQGSRENPYGREYQSGPWYQFLWGFWVLNPVNLILSIVALGVATLPERWFARLSLGLRPTEISLLRLFSWITVLFVSVMSILPIAQNFRYLAPIYGPLYLLGGFGLWTVLGLARGRMPDPAYRTLAVLIAVVVLGNGIAEYRRFEQTYVKDRVPDLSIKMVLDSRR